VRDRVGSIYGLSDPRYGIIRYVGQTTVDLRERFRCHMTEAKRPGGAYPKLNWIRSLLATGLRPEPVLLAYDIPVPFVTHLQVGNKFQPCYDFDALDNEERLFVEITKAECSGVGLRCVNSNAAYSAGIHIGYKPTDEARERQRLGHLGLPAWNKGRTKETDKRVARCGVGVSKALRGRKLSPEHIRHINEAQKGKPRTASTRARMKAAQNSPEIKLAMSERSRLRWANMTPEDRAEQSRNISAALKSSAKFQAVIHSDKYTSAEHIQRLSEAMKNSEKRKQSMQSDEYRRKVSEGARRQHERAMLMGWS